MNFSPTIYTRLKRRLALSYGQQLKQTLKAFNRLPKSPLIIWLHLHKNEFKTYHPVRWYFLKQLKNYAFFATQNFESRKGNIEFSPVEDEVFERWNNSEFADHFVKRLQKNPSVAKASAATLKILENHLVTLGKRHILKENKTSSGYRLQNSLGEIEKNSSIIKLLETTLHLEGKELNLMTSSLTEMKDFSHKIEIALKVIKKHSPTSWERFKAFTNAIIPIRQKELVSYSHQELPGYSMINLYDRDFVDLMDDLLHENGHHHLNYYLNLGKLIEEPIDCIYFSPWRNTLRPLRGIYHAYFTFFWAFKLFSDLANVKEMDSIWYLFSPREKEKIYWRAVEEYWMLDYVYRDLKTARKEGLIYKQGWSLIEAQKKEMDKFKPKIPLWERKLKAHRSELKLLKLSLKQASKQYAH